jgi:hypothetical protein
MALCQGGTSPKSAATELSLRRTTGRSEGERLLRRLAQGTPKGGCDPPRSSCGVVAGLRMPRSIASAPAERPRCSRREPPVWLMPPPPHVSSGSIRKRAPSGATRGTERERGRADGRFAQLELPMDRQQLSVLQLGIKCVETKVTESFIFD